MYIEPALKRDAVLVPDWVARQLQRHQLSLNTVLRLAELRKVCSNEDCLAILDMNNNAATYFGSSIRMGLQTYHWGRDYQSLERLEELRALFPDRCDARLFAAGQEQLSQGAVPCLAPSVTSSTKNACIAFEVKEVESGVDISSVIFVVVYPGFFGGPQSTQLQQALRREYLKQSYAPLPYEEMAKDPVFDQYLMAL
jgi:hypothetical protein